MLGVALPIVFGGFINNPNLAKLYAAQYAARVIADGGTVEALSCVVSGLKPLGITTKGRYASVWATAYDARVVADSGTVESLGCVRQGIQNLLIV